MSELGDQLMLTWIDHRTKVWVVHDPDNTRTLPRQLVNATRLGWAAGVYLATPTVDTAPPEKPGMPRIFLTKRRALAHARRRLHLFQNLERARRAWERR